MCKNGAVRDRHEAGEDGKQKSVAGCVAEIGQTQERSRSGENESGDNVGGLPFVYHSLTVRLPCGCSAEPSDGVTEDIGFSSDDCLKLLVPILDPIQ